MDSLDPNADNPLRERARRLLADCVERAESHFESAVEAFAADNAGLADVIAEEAEGLKVGGAERPFDDGWERQGRKSGETLEPIGPYQPLHELGRGGQGRVYLAEDRRLGRLVALKVLNGFRPLSEKLMRRFRREAEVASKLAHPGICTVYDAGVLDGVPFIAMRFVQGKTLAHRIDEARSASGGSTPMLSTFVDFEDQAEVAATPEPEPGTRPTSTSRGDVLEVVEILEKAARALHAAHEVGIIHRDVKPGNVMISPAGDPVLLDFGLASDEANELSLTQTGDIFGTPAYMSPEQILAGRIRLDRRTDIYSLGVTLFECVTLKRPFEAPTREVMYQAIQFKDPPDARKLNANIPLDLKVVIEKAMEKDPDRRYPTARALADDLERIREVRPIAARRIGTIGRVAGWARRRPARAALVTALILGLPAVTLLGGYAWAKQPQIDSAREQALLAEVETHLEEGYSELAHGDPKVALASFETALSLKADSGEGIGGKALALYRAEEYDGCLALLDASGEVEGGEWALSRLRIDTLWKLGRKSEAQALAQRSTNEPTTALGFFLGGSRLMHDCHYHSDKETFRKATRYFTLAALTATHARALYHYAIAHAAGHLAEDEPARRVAEALQTLWPRSHGASRWAGYALKNVDPTAANAAQMKAIELRPDQVDAYIQLGVVRLEKGELDEAIAAFEKAIEVKPDYGGAYYALGRALADQGRHGDAIAAFEKAIELWPHYARAYFNFAEALRQKGRVDDSIAALKKAIALKPDYADAYANLGATHATMGRLDAAIAAYSKALEVRPSASVYHSLGNKLAKKGRLDDAIAAYSSAIELEPDHAMAHNDLGAALRANGQVDRAIIAFQRAIELKPDAFRSHYNLGVALGDKGRHGDAVAAYSKAIELEPGYAAIHISLANALRNNGQHSEAIAPLRRAIRLQPNNAGALYNLASLLDDEGRLDEAIAAYSKALEVKPDDAEVHCNLGACHAKRGEHILALRSQRRGHELGAARAGWPYPSADWVRDRETAVLRQAAQLGSAGLGDDDAGARGEAAEGLEAVVWGWQRDVRRGVRKQVIKASVRGLVRDEPWVTLRDPTRREKLPPAERARWRRIWTAVDALVEAVRRGK